MPKALFVPLTDEKVNKWQIQAAYEFQIWQHSEHLCCKVKDEQASRSGNVLTAVHCYIPNSMHGWELRELQSTFVILRQSKHY